MTNKVNNMPRCDIEELKEELKQANTTIDALKSDLKEVIKVLLKTSPQHIDWIKNNYSELMADEEN